MKMGLCDTSDDEDEDESVAEDVGNLLRAAVRGDLEKVRHFIISKGVGVDAVNYQGWTAFHFACINGHVEVNYLLISCSDFPASV